MKNVAVITGVSSGIGKEFAAIHAERGGDLVIIARREDKLNEIKRDLESKHGVEVMVIARDLTRPEAAQEIYDEMKKAGVEVEYLINNAGFGGRGKFHERPWEQDLSMIQLNIIALTALSRLFLPDFVKRNRGRILNVSSTASLMPGPLQAVYYATKAFVTFLSNALTEELHDSEVTVTALLPGATESEFGSTSGMDKTPLFKKTATARSVALAGYNGMIAGKMNVISAPLSIRLSLIMTPFLPKKVVLSQVRKMQEV